VTEIAIPMPVAVPVGFSPGVGAWHRGTGM